MSSMSDAHYAKVLKNLHIENDRDFYRLPDESSASEAEKRNTKLQEIYRGVMATNEKLMEMNQALTKENQDLRQQLKERAGNPAEPSTITVDVSVDAAGNPARQGQV
jgi:hypothetical protein